MIRWLFTLAVLFATPALAQVDEPRPQWEGVWQGTIGNLPVRACFFQQSDTWTVGSYYYLSRMRAIGLHSTADGVWEEGFGNSTGRWTVRPSGNSLTGNWQHGNRRLAITLTRVRSGPSEGGACGSAEYIAPRLRPITQRTSPKVANGFAFTEVRYDVGPNFGDVEIATFRYPATRPGDRAINRALQLDPGVFEGESDYLSCLKQSLANNGLDGDFSVIQQPTLVTRDFMTVLFAGGYSCGGAHPDSYGFHRVYDRDSGQRIDLSTWFQPTAIIPRLPDDSSDQHHLTPQFRALVLRQGRNLESDCREVVEQADYWDIALTRTGMDFTPGLPHAALACGDAISVSHAAFAPQLSQAGRAGWARLARSEATR